MKEPAFSAHVKLLTPLKQPHRLARNANRTVSEAHSFVPSEERGTSSYLAQRRRVDWLVLFSTLEVEDFLLDHFGETTCKQNLTPSSTRRVNPEKRSGH